MERFGGIINDARIKIGTQLVREVVGLLGRQRAERRGRQDRSVETRRELQASLVDFNLESVEWDRQDLGHLVFEFRQGGQGRVESDKRVFKSSRDLNIIERSQRRYVELWDRDARAEQVLPCRISHRFHIRRTPFNI